MKKLICFISCIVFGVLALIFAKGIIGGTPLAYKLMDNMANKGSRAIVRIDSRGFTTFNGPNVHAENADKMALTCEGYGKKAKFTVIYGDPKLISSVNDYAKQSLKGSDKIILVGTLQNPLADLSKDVVTSNPSSLFMQQCEQFLQNDLSYDAVREHDFFKRLESRDTSYLWLNVEGVYKMPFIYKLCTIAFMIISTASFIAFIFFIFKDRDEIY